MNEDNLWNKELEILISPYVFLGQNQGGIKITGVALKEGVFKDVLYSEKELRKVANLMKGLPIKVEHGRTKEFGGLTVGKVESSYWDPLLRSILFSAIVTNSKAIEYIKSGTLGAVSSSTWMEKRSAGHGGLKIGSEYNFQELSLVKQPACDKCFIFHVEQLSNRILGNNLNIKKTANTIEGELQLTKQDNEIIEETFLDEEEGKEELIGEEELSPQLCVILELPDEESLSELKKVYNVKRYYFDYRSPYKKYKKVEELKAVTSKEVKETFTPKKSDVTNVTGKPMDHQIGAPNPEACSDLLFVELKGKVKCKLCNKDFPNILGFFKHFLAEHPKYAEDEKYKEKYKEKYPEKKSGISCPVCADKFETDEEFGKHWAEKHKEKYGEFKETMSLFEELARETCKVRKMPNGRFMAMKPSGKKFPPFKILGNFATEEEAKKACGKADLQAEPKTDEERAKTHFKISDEKWEELPDEKKEEYIKKLPPRGSGREENQDEYQEKEEDKDKYGCKVGQEKWDPKLEKCIPLPKEEQSAYADFIGKCRKSGKSMKECADAFKKQSGKKGDNDYPKYKEKEEKTKREEETLSDEKKEIVEEKKVETVEEKKEETKVKTEGKEEKKEETSEEKVESKETPGQTITVRFEHVFPQPKSVVPEVKEETKTEATETKEKAPEKKVEEAKTEGEVVKEKVETETKEMTDEELLKELHGRGAEIILRSYTRKEK